MLQTTFPYNFRLCKATLRVCTDITIEFTNIDVVFKKNWASLTLVTYSQLWVSSETSVLKRVRKNERKRLLASSSLDVWPSVCPSACNNLAPNKRDFHYIWYPRAFRKSAQKNSELKSEKNNDYFTWRLTKMYRVSIKSFPDYKHWLQENYVEYKHFLPLL